MLELLKTRSNTTNKQIAQIHKIVCTYSDIKVKGHLEIQRAKMLNVLLNVVNHSKANIS